MTSSSVRDAREALGGRLRDIRKDAGLSGVQLAELAGWHSSKVSKIESGKQMPAEADIRIWCRHCKAKGQVPDLIATLRNVEAAYVEWKRIAGIRRKQQQLHTLEEDTRLTRWFEPVIMPGLLQTQDYMWAMLSKVSAFYGHDEPVDDGIAARLERQQVLHHGNHRFNFVLAEQVLYTTVGSDDVMIGQLDHLLSTMRLPNVVVSVIPQMSDYQVPTTNFAIFDRKVAFVETISAELTITQPRELTLYEQVFQTLLDQAVVGEAARVLIGKAMGQRQPRP
ncbi:helix-turn-helix domain-containing protein [Nocardia mexicana]|uniref:Transcriptional regulator with XRE-family HTH domain n=1 Tax=Nocardia mexicana TaxID=279262 RepID=A0A370HAN9_9NOCA|nr:helix-turn-helix transcriptional regulator [Nocardia mexicana]RDI53999.1 transcriptional regulator with XRE-family HTH domain [Nocardia mexicana]